MSEEKVMRDGDDAAQIKTVTGWVSRHGRFFGEDEITARYDGCTHQRCSACEAEVPKGYGYCGSCRAARMTELYNTKPFQEWDGEPLVIHDSDQYFFSEEDIEDYCEEHEIKSEDLQLVICEPSFCWQLEPDDIYCDILPEDCSLENIWPELWEAIETANKIIREGKRPISWSPGKYRTTVNLLPEPPKGDE